MEQIFRRESVRARIFGNPLGPVLQQYITYLKARGHKPSSVHQYVFALEHFGNWLGTGAISHESVDEFVARHIPRCRCKKPAPCTSHCIRAALNRLLEMRGLSRPDAVEPAAVAHLLREYETHLLVVAGLAESTAYYRLRHARDLLQHFTVQHASQLRRWEAIELADYVACTGRRWKPGGGQQLASSVRSFLRFLLFKGLVRRDLATAIPSFANWRLSSLPAVVERTKLEKLLAAVDPATSIGMRDLRLDTGGAVHIRGKGRKDRTVPLWRESVRLIRGWLKKTRATLDAPLVPNSRGGHMTRSGIEHRLQVILERAAKTAPALSKIPLSPHTIRHTTAMHLLQSGVDLSVIAMWLGHESIETTHQYLDADLETKRRALDRLQSPKVRRPGPKARTQLVEFLRRL